MPSHLATLRKFVLVFSAVVSSCCAGTTSYGGVVFGGPNAALDSDAWSLEGNNLSQWRSAVTNPANFGPGGIVDTQITLQSMGTIDAGTLAGIDVFVSPWWEDSDTAPYTQDIVDYFRGGGSLLLLQDGPDFDAIGTALGLGAENLRFGTLEPNTVASSFQSGPFGTATVFNQNQMRSELDPAAVASTGGTAISFNSSGGITGAVWKPGVYAAGAGALAIISDVSVFENNTANYNTLNGNATFALNVTAFLANNAGVTSNVVPEPTSAFAWILLGGPAALLRRRRP